MNSLKLRRLSQHRPKLGDFLKRHRSQVAFGAVGALAAGVLSVLAVQDPGYVAQSVDLTRPVVWVTNESQLLVGRVNRQIDELDSAVRVVAKPFDVYQDGETVLTLDSTKHELRPIDPASVTLAGRIKVPADAAIGFGGGVLAIADEATGQLWSGAVQELGTLDPELTPETAKTGRGVAVTVAQTGTVFAVAPGSDSLWTIPRAPGVDGAASAATGAGAETTGSTAGADAASPPQATGGEAPTDVAVSPLTGGELSQQGSGAQSPISVTAVGDTPVVLDRVAGTLRIPDRTVAIPGAASAVLQQPGPESDVVDIATSSALLEVSLATGEVRTVIADRSGAPAAPVRIDGCVHSAWSSSPAVYGLTCAGKDALVRDIPGHTGTDAMVFRVNGHVIVLNDVVTGSVWVAEDQIKLINNWADVQPQADEADQQDQSNAQGLTTQLATPNLNCTAGMHIKPPTAQDDSYGVRPGRATVLRVLDNDSSDNCAMTVITGVSGWDGGSGDLNAAIVDSGQALQVTVPKTATGTLPVLTYRVTDGFGNDAEGHVTVTAYESGEHKPAVKIRNSLVPVETLGTVSYNVLDDYVSPTGDDLYLVSASTDTGDEVTFQPGGLITFADKGVGGAVRKTVDFVIGDDGGSEPVAGKLTVDVRPQGTADPVTSPVYARAIVGQAATVDIMSNVIVPSVEKGQLAAVTPLAKGAITVNGIHQAAGTVTLTGSKAGSYYFIYQAKGGEKTAEGLLRVDVVDPASGRQPPTGVTDVVYLPEGSVTTVDPIANDIDPMGSGLAVIQVQPDESLSATLEALHTVTIAARSAQALQQSQGGSIAYTVSNGYAAAPGLIRVVPVPAADPLPPVARDIDATVRAGDAVTIPIAGYAYDPTGDVIRLTGLDAGTAASVPGVLFHTDSAIRYLAPTTAPARPLRFAYTVTNSAGLSSSGAVTLQVDGAAATQNHPPAQPEPVVARVFTGSTVTVSLPLSGIDPDGDWVTLSQIGDHAGDALGEASPSGLSSIEYTAGTTAGPDTFNYTAADPSGETTTGQVTVLVVAPPDAVQPPTAPDLHVTARPGRTVAVDVIKQIAAVNSSQQLSLGDPAFVAPPNWVVKADSGNGRLVVTTPATELVGSIKYNVVNQLGMAASGIVTVTVSKTAALEPPTARDIVVDPTTIKKGATSVVVPVPDDKLTNSSGTLNDLVLSLDPASATAGNVVGDRTISVTLTDSRQVVAYRVTNSEKAFATAFIVVPPQVTKQVPLVVTQPGTPPTVKAGQPLTIDISTMLRASDGSVLQIPNGAAVSVSGGGDVGRIDATHLKYTSPKNGSGTAFISLTVGDGSDRTAVAQISVQVVPAELPAPVVKAAHLSVEVGKTATLDLAGLVTAGDAQQQKLLTYAITGGGGALESSVKGSVLTVSAAITAKGQQANFTLTATDGQGKSGTGAVTVTAVGSAEPLMRVASVTVNDGRPGVATAVNAIAQVTYNPFPQAPTLVDARVQSGAGSAAVTGGSVSITPTRVGTVVVAFTLRDATGDSARDVSGTATVIVKDKPDAPGTPTLIAMTPKTAQIKWTLPKDNGSPITGYTVTDAKNHISQSCSASPCTINGLTPGITYSFAVVATNAVGTSDASSGSADITPDTAPNTPSAPSVTWLDGQNALQVDWSDPGSDGTPVSSYDLEISSAGAGGQTTTSVDNVTSYTWGGLSFGTAYSFRVRAHNASKEPSGWSPMSASETPSKKPGAPQSVSVSFGSDNYSPGGNTLSVTWSAPSDDGGSAITEYTVAYNGGTVSAGPSATSATIQGVSDGVEYSVTVTATNRSGPGDVSNSSSATPFSPPGAVTGLAATPTGVDRQVTVSWTNAQGHGRTIDHYEVSYNGTSVSASSPATINGLTNGTQYSFTVTACYSATDATFNTCGDGATATATPYGPVGAVTNLNASASGTDSVNFSWSPPPDNGRSPMGAQYLDGSTWRSGTSFSKNVGCGGTFTLSVRGVDSQGLVGPTSTAKGSAAACPQPEAVISLGRAGTSATGECAKTVTNCNQIDLSLTNFSPNSSQDYVCYGNLGGWGPFASGTVNVNSGGSFSGGIGCWMGYGLSVYVTVGGAQSNTISR